jgi:murein DD-endopeptidase MepM/ murein hydrolase activator NlpD
MTLAEEEGNCAEPHRPVPRRSCGVTAVVHAISGGLTSLLMILLLPHTTVAQLTLQPPVTPACVSSPFGWRHAVGPHAPAGFHNGIDLPARAGALVHAAAAGTIEVIKRQGLGGVTVHLRHPGGLETLYAHLGNLVPAIAQGKRNVAAGEALGHVARTGVTYGTHVFFAVLENGKAVDPLDVLPPLPRCGGPKS